MKKIVAILITLASLLLFSGCYTDKAYEASKELYVGGRAAVEANQELIGENTLKKLKAIDAAATAYDKTRTKVKEVLDAKPDD